MGAAGRLAIRPDRVVAEITHAPRDFPLLDHVLPYRVVLVLHLVDDLVDVFVVDVALGEDDFLLDDGAVVLNRADVFGLVLMDDKVIGFDHARGWNYGLAVIAAGVIDGLGAADHLFAVVFLLLIAGQRYV